jgi:hypothetical protein
MRQRFQAMSDMSVRIWRLGFLQNLKEVDKATVGNLGALLRTDP